MSADREELLGRTVAGKYTIESFVGGGAMGDVFVARQTALEKKVAIKVLHRELAIYEELTARFHREALAASRLDHPGSIRVLDFGEEPDGLLYIAMEYVSGTDLQRVVANGHPLGERRVIGIATQALAAVEAAHAHGILHRDLKPENILVQAGTDDDGRPVDIVKVCDFGIAKIVEPRSDPGNRPAPAPITATGLAVGTPEYMSPEQARGTPVDARSDVYSMGVVLYYMLTNALPFQAETAVGVAVKHLFDEPKRPSERRAEVSPGLEAVCLKAMRKKPDERHQSARQMRAELLALLDERAVDFSLRETLPAIDEPTAPEAPERALADAARAPTVSMEEVRLGTSQTHAPVAPRWGRLAWVGPAAVIAALAAALLRLGGPATAGDPRAPVSASVARSAREAASDTRPLVAPAPSVEAQGEPPEPPAIALHPSSGAHLGPPRPLHSALGATPGHAPGPLPPEPPPAPPPAAVPTGLPAPPPPVAATPPPVTGAPAPPPPAAIDPSAARVSIGGVTTTGGLPASSVRGVIVHGGFTRCYQDALRAAGAAAGGTATLHLNIDDTGHVTSASAGGMGFLPGARACVEAAARALRVPNVDTGEATADVQLSFVPK